MIGKATDSILKAGAVGTMVNASTYGRTIPLIYGTVRSPLLAIWAANIRQGSSSKKKKKKGVQTYIENIDLLVGHNPLAQSLQWWTDANNFLPLQFKKATFTLSSSPAWGEVVISDANFYGVVAVTVTASFSATFNDWGTGGGSGVSGAWEVPCWNAAFNGPDPVNSSAYRNFPYAYYWIPGSGTTVKFPFFGTGDVQIVNVYYAALSPTATEYAALNLNTDNPLTGLRLTWESHLGNYTAAYAPEPTQQIIYPFFAGFASPDIDLGASGAIPNLNVEMQGSFPVYADSTLATAGGDADFGDMIEDIFASGPAQAGIDGALGLTAVQHGLNCNDFPGVVQKKLFFNATTLPVVPYDLPVTAGQFLVAAYREDTAGSAPSGISDTLGNSWTSILAANPASGIYCYAWYCQVAATGQTAITIANAVGANHNLQLMEVGGFDTLESVVTGGAASALAEITISSSTPRMFPGLVLTWFDTEGDTALTTNPRWLQLMNNQPTVTGYSEERTVHGPATLTDAHALAPSTPWAAFGLAFKNTQAPQYPVSLGRILEPTTLANARAGARAGGLWGSINMNSSRKASDILKDLYASMNAAPVWSGFQLKSIAWSEVSAAGNGAIFYAPSAGGPVANLAPPDFVDGGLTVERKAEVDAPPILSMQHGYRLNNYNQVLTTEPNPAGIALFGVRKASPMKRDEIQDPAIARTLLGIAARDQVYLRNTYKAKLKANHCLLEPMDVVTLYDPQLPLGTPSPNPVAIQSATGSTVGPAGTVAIPFPQPVGAGGTVVIIASTVPPIGTPGVNILGITNNQAVPTTIEVSQGPAGNSQVSVAMALAFPNPGGFIVYVPTGAGFTTSVVAYELPGIWTIDNVNTFNADVGGPSGTLGVYLSSSLPEYMFGAAVFENAPPPTTLTLNGFGYGKTAASLVTIQGMNRLPPGPGSVFLNVSWAPTISDEWSYLYGYGLAVVMGAMIPPAGFVYNPGGAGVSGIGAYRVTSVQEDDKHNIDAEFEDFIYGLHAPQPPATVTPTAPYRPIYGADPGSVNTPIILEAVPRLGQVGNQEELWVVLSSNNANYGGAVVYISTDGGASYQTQQGWVTQGSATTGYTVGDWPAHADPDMADNLAVNLTESNGELGTYTVSQEDAFAFVCYVEGGTTPIPYELMGYAVADLTSAYHYTLMATGTGNKLRRSVFGAPTAGAGVDHPNNSRFAFLGNPAQNAPAGIVRIPVDPAWIGTTIYLKFPAFNTFNSAAQNLADVTAYPFTITGLPGGVNPYGIPPNLVTVN